VAEQVEPVRTDFRALPDLAGRVLGGAVLTSNDDFYAPAHSLIKPGIARHDPDAYDDKGKVYDGWETRRRREPGTDYAIIRLAVPGIIRGVNIDTAFFKGNYPPVATVEGATLLGYPSADEVMGAQWFTIVDKTDLDGDSANVVLAAGPERLVTHVKLTMLPDGGIARFRAHGHVVPDPRVLGGRVNLASTLHGALVAACSNMFYSSPANVLAPGRSRVMSDGWETARRRDDGNDWLTVALAAPGMLHDVVIDTSRFVGNAPGWASLTDADTGAELLPRTALIPDTEHRFRLVGNDVVSKVRLDIFPDGGISRLHVNGEVAPGARDGIVARWLDLLPAEQAALVDPAEFFD
jgi:allantoicase